MEYLMTYGWAILIVAVVIVALFQLGIFNNSNLTPRALAGACEVVRNAAGSSLAGQCNNEIPQSVAHFNGQNSYVQTPVSSAMLGSSLTVSLWIELYGSPNTGIFQIANTLSNNLPFIYLQRTSTGIFWYVDGNYYLAETLSNNAYYNVVLTYDGSTWRAYKNGQPDGTYSGGVVMSGTNTWFGNGYDGYFSGLLSNVQIYNTSLSSSEISMLYTEGIGGAPIDPTHIVGWWPLNGNANDYSGNNNNGAQTSISYNSTWTSGYVQP